MALLTWARTTILPTSLKGCLVLLFEAWLSWYLISTYFSYRRLRHIPGPPLAAITSLWWLFGTASEKGHLVVADVCNRYGSIARLSPNMVVTDDMELYRKANNSKNGEYVKSKWYKAFKMDNDNENLFSEIDDERHAKSRQKLAPGYSGRDNPAAESTIDEVVMSLVQLINRKYISVRGDLKAFDWAVLSQYLTLDVITYLALGEPFGFVADDEDKFNYIGSLERNWPSLNLFTHAPLLAAICRVPFIQKQLLPKVTDAEGLGKVKGVAQSIISRRFKEGKTDRHDMVLSFKKNGLSQNEIADQALLQLLAGSDTTATILRTGLLSITSNPRIYNRLRDEIDAHVESTSLSLDKVVSNQDALKLPYLQACITESLRHHPAGTGLLPRVVGPSGDTHNGVYLPPGTEIAFCAWNLHKHNTAVYGPDATLFRPERWLEAPPEQLAKMEESVHLCFGYGRFRCLGEYVAKMELNKGWFELLRRFDWAHMDPQQPLTKNANYGLFVQKGIWMRVEKREA